MTTIDGLPAAELHPTEQAVLREAADALVFAPSATDEALQDALLAADELVDRMVQSGRLPEETADGVIAELEACGPLLEAVA